MYSKNSITNKSDMLLRSASVLKLTVSDKLRH